MSGASKYSPSTIRAAFGLVGAILQGGRGGDGSAGDIRRTRREPLAEGFGFTDVYRPADGASERAAILLVHGLTEDGPDDHRIPTFATTCARGGMTVVVPEFPMMKARRMQVEDVDEVARAAAAVPDAADVAKVVPLAFSYAAGPTLLASARLPDGLVAGTVTVGAYYDLDHLLEYTATRRVDAYGDRQPDAPRNEEKRREGQWIFLASAARWLDDEDERGVVAEAATAWEAGIPPSWDELRRSLGSGGRALLDSVTRGDPEEHRQARKRLPDEIRRAMERLSPRGKLDDLRTPVVLIHGRNDSRIPFRESVLLRSAIRDHSDVTLAILNAFVHAQRDVGWSRFWRVAGDAVKLGRCGLEILGWAV